MNPKYNHTEVETNKEKKWRENKYFSTHTDTKEPYAILLPPPNVTGKLHIGHAWDVSIQDALIRYHKLQDKDVMWIAAMDHAGIATQAKVEARLKEQNISRYDLGREKFLSKVWDWKEEYAETIRQQWQKLGIGLDYENERFTLDDDASSAVQKVFIDLYNRKLIYRDLRPVNWDPELKTVLSNMEVINKDTSQDMYYIDYELKTGGHITIATVRVETLFSDVAIAINPKDEKMQKYVGKIAIHPLTGKECPIITDKHIEIGKGTGAMKVSAHAEPDFVILKKNDLPIIECIDKDGLMNEEAMEFVGLDRFEARKKIVEKLKKLGKISKIENGISAVGYSERSGAAVEVLIQPQWFVNMKPMAKKIIEDLDSGSGVNFEPKRFEDTLRRWMDEVHDWCISRQLWWGHRIPAWYKDDEVRVQIDSPGEGWKQDDDVLDTWFSSGITPFTFLGWPKENNLLKRFYPSNVLVTGYDIIFFWVARMYFQSLDIMKAKPFKDVLIHGLIRDEQGRKMSKSLGNGVDPMETIDKYGSDSLRWFLLTNSTAGQDIRYSPKKIEAAWNLNNKLWNISRYILEVMPEGASEKSIADNWIEQKFTKLVKLIELKMKTYEFTIIGKELTKFITEDFSSWYIEISKEAPNQKFAKELLSNLMIVLHPFMPFITDHIYNLTNGAELLETLWPKIEVNNSISKIDDVIEVVKLLRTFRFDYQISNKEKVLYDFSGKLSNQEFKMINKLANAEVLENEDILLPYGKEKLYIKESEELKANQAKTKKTQIEFLTKEIKRAEGMLANPNFTNKAPEEKVKLEKEKLEKFKSELTLIKKY